MRVFIIVSVLLAALSLSGLAVGAEAPSGPIVSTDWLAGQLDNPDVRVIEVSVIPGVFERGHIPGAVNLAWHTDLVETVVRDIVAPDRFEDLLQSAGVNDDSTIVLYGDNNNWFAAWGAWIFHYYGIENVKILDGGRAKWEAEGRELSIRPTVHARGNITVTETNPHYRAGLADVLDVVTDDEDHTAILDIRSVAEYEGRIFAPEGVQELAIRAGHIPGAVNVPWDQAVNSDGTFKSVEDLRALYASVGIDGSKPVIVYCRIGERSSHTWFVLTQILGYEVAQYDGSWTEWGNAVGVPIVNIAGTVWGAQ